MNTTELQTPARIHVDHSDQKRLGSWTTARNFEVRARRGSVVIDLRGPSIPDGDIELDLRADRAMIKLLVPEDALIDHQDLTWTGRGKVKQTFHHNPAAGTGRRIHLTGQVHDAEIRVHSGGVAVLSAMFTRDYVADVRRAHADGTFPTVDDPTRTA
ncbi:hypothetical protein AB0I81_25740 [Nonomuraea sp. NPDC050404]|uniref:hypothetical protein n=1 Tax=Nonomuraea sp. NPDC050404 TaxID=3155783 RepID=UPI0033D30CB5